MTRIEATPQSKADSRALGRVAAAGVVSVVCGALAVAAAFAVAPEKPAGPAGSAQLTLVAQADVPDALQTVVPEQRAAVEDDITGCKRLAALMTISPIPGSAAPASGFVQIRSGDYLSPPFKVGAYPVSIMVPMPQPMPAVTGAMGVLGVAQNVRIQFTPPLDLPVVNGTTVQPVYWRPTDACSSKG